MTPQTVNAYYHPAMNEIVFPAAILQPPFFEPDADDAVNYGAIGAVIGHEIGHGFDDRGGASTATGTLRDWWTPPTIRNSASVRSYSSSNSIGSRRSRACTSTARLPSARTSATSPAWHRLQGLQDLARRPAGADHRRPHRRSALLHGLGPGLALEDARRAYARAGHDQPASTREYRANGPLSHVDAFYDAFSVKPGDKMYRAPDQRVRIW